jgi:lysyl-tRNA synthetase class II
MIQVVKKANREPLIERSVKEDGERCKTCGQLPLLCESVILRTPCVNALEASEEGVTDKMIKIRRRKLAERLATEDEPNLSLDERAMISDAVNAAFSAPAIVGAVCPLLDEAVEPSDEVVVG